MSYKVQRGVGQEEGQSATLVALRCFIGIEIRNSRFTLVALSWNLLMTRTMKLHFEKDHKTHLWLHLPEQLSVILID